MKKVLIIAYYFPPLGGGGVQRPLKFCKYLPEFGWQPVVLTAKNGVGPVYDQTLLDELNTYKDVKVYRTFSFELGAIKKILKLRISELANYLKNRIFKRQCRTQNAPRREIFERFKGSDIRQSVNPSILQSINSALKKVFDFCYDTLFKFQKICCIPDDKILWAVPSLFSALCIIKKEKPDLIFVTVPPYSSFMLGVLLKIFSGKKLLVDYRDPWTLPYNKKLSDTIIENWCLKNTKNLVYAVPKIFDWIQELFNKSLTMNNINHRLIYNGFDETDYEKISAVEFDKFTLISGGDLYGEENIYFFQFLEKIVSKNKDMFENFQFILCCNPKKWFEEYLKKSSISDKIIYKKYLPKKEYLSLLKGADMVSLFTGFYAEDIELHGRIFDYLFFQKKILVVTNTGSMHEKIINEIMPDIPVFRKNEYYEIENYLLTAVRTRNSFSEKYEMDKLYRYSRKIQTSELSFFFNEIIERN